MVPLHLLLLTLLYAVVLLAALAVWGVIVKRLDRGEPMLRIEPRRQVPWTGWDLLVILGVYVAWNVATIKLAVQRFGAEVANPPIIENPGPIDSGHPIARLFAEATWPTMVVCLILAVVVAPLAEEILFRLFLQGWLEKVDRRLRRRLPGLVRWCRWGTLPVVTTSVLFALPHFRGAVRQYDPRFLFFMLVGGGIAQLNAVLVGIVIARYVRGATWADLGWQPRKFLGDARLGLAALAAVIVPVFVVQYLLKKTLPPEWTADPIPLFFFALTLGTLYLRTHRIVPSIVAHMTLNVVAMLVAGLAKGG